MGLRHREPNRIKGTDYVLTVFDCELVEGGTESVEGIALSLAERSIQQIDTVGNRLGRRSSHELRHGAAGELDMDFAHRPQLGGVDIFVSPGNEQPELND
jgi:hypothetical protein